MVSLKGTIVAAAVGALGMTMSDSADANTGNVLAAVGAQVVDADGSIRGLQESWGALINRSGTTRIIEWALPMASTPSGSEGPLVEVFAAFAPSDVQCAYVVASPNINTPLFFSGLVSADSTSRMLVTLPSSNVQGIRVVQCVIKNSSEVLYVGY
jgi:hypothetical protein